VKIIVNPACPILSLTIYQLKDFFETFKPFKTCFKYDAYNYKCLSSIDKYIFWSNWRNNLYAI